MPMLKFKKKSVLAICILSSSLAMAQEFDRLSTLRERPDRAERTKKKANDPKKKQTTKSTSPDTRLQNEAHLAVGTQLLTIGSLTQTQGSILLLGRYDRRIGGNFYVSGGAGAGVLTYASGSPLEQSGSTLELGAGLQWKPINIKDRVKWGMGLMAGIHRSQETVGVKLDDGKAAYDRDLTQFTPELSTEARVKFLEVRGLGEKPIFKLQALAGATAKGAIPIRRSSQLTEPSGKTTETNFGYHQQTSFGPISGAAVGGFLGVGGEW